MKTDPRLELKGALKNLRMLVKEVGYNYIASLQSEITKIDEDIRYVELSKGISRKQLSVFSKMISKIEKLKIKPSKGRRKDLKHLDEIIQEIKSYSQEL